MMERTGHYVVTVGTSITVVPARCQSQAVDIVANKVNAWCGYAGRRANGITARAASWADVERFAVMVQESAPENRKAVKAQLRAERKAYQQELKLGRVA